MSLSVAAAGIGFGYARHVYRRADKQYQEPLAIKAPALYHALYNKWYVDEAYDYAFTGRKKLGDVRLGVLGLGEVSAWTDSNVIDGTVNAAGWATRAFATLSSWWDKWIIDGLLVNGPAYLMLPFAYIARLTEWGLVQWYALCMVMGLVGFVFYYVYR